MQRNFTEIFMDQKTPNGPWLRLGSAPRRAQPTRARQEAQVRPGGLCPPQVPRTAYFLYKYPNIPETLRESMKINSSGRRV